MPPYASVKCMSCPPTDHNLLLWNSSREATTAAQTLTAKKGDSNVRDTVNPDALTV